MIGAQAFFRQPQADKNVGDTEKSELRTGVFKAAQMAWEKARRFQFELPAPGVSWTYPFRTIKDGSGQYLLPGNLKAFSRGEGWATNEVRLDFIPLEEADVEAVLYPNPPPLLPAPPQPLYEKWEPQGGRDEGNVGNVFYATVKLVPLHGDTRPIPNAFFKFRLSEVSHEPGVCMNAPYRDKPAIPGTAVPADLNFASDPALSITESPTEITADTVSANANAITIEVNCYDYGAYGKLSVTATTQSGKTLTVRIEGYAGQTALTLPLDQNNNQIADAWEKRKGYFQYNLRARYDADPEPVSKAFQGDGLSFYEEYRGFQVSGVYQRLSPLKKDLFVRDENGLLAFSLADWTSLYPAGRFSEAALQINYTRQALAPQVRLITSQPGDLPSLRVYGWTAQEVVAEQSVDLVHWAPFSTNVVTGAGWWEPPLGINPLNRCFYRAIWRP